MPKLPTTPASFSTPVAASRARSKAQEIVDANREKAEKLFNGRTAKKSLIQLLARADRELSTQLDEMKQRGPTFRPWTQADTEATLSIVREQLGRMSPEFKALLNANAARARELGVRGTVELLEHFEQTMPGTIRPLALEGASHLLQTTLLSRYQTSVARYGQQVIASIQRELAVGTLINRTFDEMAGRLQREQPLLSRRYFAERIVRTECMNAYNAGHLDEINAQRAGAFPDLEKKLIETFDKRTGQDSFKAHGQIRKPNEMFIDGNGRQYLHPPGRPNDRGVVVPWRREWDSKSRSAEPEKKQAQPLAAPPQSTKPIEQEIGPASLWKSFAYQSPEKLAEAMAKVFGASVPTPKYFEAIYSGAGISAKLNSVSYSPDGSVTIGCKLLKGRREAGDLLRVFRRENNELIVKHDVLTLGKKYQGGGYAKQTLAQSVAAYKSLGVSSIELRAEQVGRYAWASFGWQWDAKTIERMKPKLEKFLADQDLPVSEAGKIVKHPWHVADLTNAKGEKIGKTFLLERIEGWNGKLDLNERSPSYQRLLSKIQPKKS